MIMDFILFLLTVHGKKIAKSCYSVHSSMRASNIISPEGKVKGSLSGYLLKVRAQEVTNNIFLSLRFHDIAKYILIPFAESDHCIRQFEQIFISK